MAKPIIQKENIKMNVHVSSKEEAIRETGKLLVENGYAKESYIESMLEREVLTSTYMGNYLAIPHGTEGSHRLIKETGISIIHLPTGVDFGDGQTVKLLVGIAGKNGEHLDILSKIAIICSEEENVKKMIDASDKDELLEQLGELE